MKKFMILLICTVMLVSSIGCAKTSESGKEVQLPNPFTECKTVGEAEKLFGYKVFEPSYIPEGYKMDTISVIEGTLVEINYSKDGKQLVYRQGKGKENLSGIYDKFDEKKSIDVGNAKVELAGVNGKINVVTWFDDDSSYSLIVDGLEMEEIIQIVESIKESGSFGGMSNPFVDFENIEKAEEFAGFKLSYPDEIEGYKKDVIQAIEKDLLQVIYTNDNKDITIRKSKEKGDISGDYGKYGENRETKVGNKRVNTRGNDGKVKTAIWNEGEFSYSITANLGDEGLSEQVIIQLIKGIS